MSVDTIEQRIEFIKSTIKLEDYVVECFLTRKAYESQFENHGNYRKFKTCPFHDDKRRGCFTVSIPQQIFYCFGCHVGGDIISFLCKLESCNQYNALILLEKKYWKSLVSEVNQKIKNQEPYEDQLKELMRIQTILLENDCF